VWTARQRWPESNIYRKERFPMQPLFITLTRICAAIAVAAMLAACGSLGAQIGAPGPPQQLDSCTLLTQADAEALLGGPVAAPSTNQIDAGDQNDERAVSQCLYHTSGDDYKSVSVLIRRGVAGEQALAGLQQLHERNALGGAQEPVTGLGDAALWNHGGDHDQLNVAQGRFLLIASADLGKGVPTLDISKVAAQRVLARLP
jgi:hypothetical protein